MRTGQMILITVLTGAFLQFSPRAHGQITRSFGKNGQIVYVNTDAVPSHRPSKTVSDPANLPVAAVIPTASLPGDTGTHSVLDEVKAAVAQQEQSDRESRLDRIVQEAAERHKVDPALVKAVISTESDWNPSAISNKGAVGLMQLIPETAQRFGVQNSLDPVQNIEGGTSYLRALLDRYNGDLTKTLAAYNAGERAVDLSKGVPQYRETRNYVKKVTSTYFRPKSRRDVTLWSPPRAVIRRDVTGSGEVIFTNE